MANRRRGEVEAVVDGEPVVLCLTLGALAELEAAFAADDLVALGARFADGRLSARDLTRIFVCGLRGGGRMVGEAEVAAMRIDGGLAGVARVVAELLEVTFGRPDGDGATAAAVPPGRSGEGSAGVRPPGVPGTAASPFPGTR